MNHADYSTLIIPAVQALMAEHPDVERVPEYLRDSIACDVADKLVEQVGPDIIAKVLTAHGY